MPRMQAAITLIVAVLVSAAAAQSPSQVLMELYESTAGDGWSNNSGWGSGDPCDSAWYGVECTSGDVTSINLYDNNLVGTIPDSVGSLEHLNTLVLWKNKLTGSIPDLSAATRLQVLDLADNELSGSIPEYLGELSLTELWLNANELSDDIPEDIFSMNSLRKLVLYSNRLTGTIPDTLDELSNLEVMWLYFNNLEGELPDSVGDMKKLVQLDLGSNAFSGELPSSLGDLDNVEQIWLSRNEFSGSIPEELAELGKLNDLELEENSFSGDLNENPLFNDDTHDSSIRIAASGNKFDCPLPVWCGPEEAGGDESCTPCVEGGSEGSGWDWWIWALVTFVALVMVGGILVAGAVFVLRRLRQARQRQQIENSLDFALSEFE